MIRRSPTAAELPILGFERIQDWATWLEANHASSAGVWLRLAKKGSNLPSVTYDEALDVALCFGWIDGQKQAQDDRFWRQKFTPRTGKSLWSKKNRDKAQALIDAGSMQAAGVAEVERAKRDGRWDAAYDSSRTAGVPPDLQAALDANADAAAFFRTLDSRNRFAVLFRIQTAKKADTRARRIAQFVAMLERGERLHP